MYTFETCARAKYINIDNLRKTINEGPYDAVIVMSAENVPYYSGYYNYDLRVLPERLHYVIWPKGGEPAFVVINRRKANLLPDDTFIAEVVGYDGEGLESADTVVEVLRDRGITSGRVGFESLQFPAGVLTAIQAQLPDVVFEDAYTFLESPRLVKTPAEIEIMERIAGWTTAAMDVAFAEARPGVTEQSISARMQYELLKNGAEMIAFPTFGSGVRTGIFHGLASQKLLEPGDIFKVDFGGTIEGYYSDLARTAVVGKASDRQKDIYAKIMEIKDRIVDSIKPGVLASEVAMVGRKAYDDLNLEYKWSILGHSLGMGLHESPQLYPWVHEPILENMVMMIEVGYNDLGHDSFHVEDMIVVTKNGAEYRSDFSQHRTLWEVGV